MSSSLSDQLGQLRDRQRRLIEQIADELVMADKEVEGKIAAELAPLQAEVERLRQSLQQVVQEKEEKAIELEELQEEIRAFFHRATDTKPKRATAYSTSAEPATPSAEKPRPLKVTLPKVKKERKPFRFKRLAVRTVAVAVVAAGLFFGWHQFTATVNRNMAASGQVAGVSTNRPATKGKGAVSPSMSVQQAEVAQAIQDDPNDPSNHPEIYAQTPFKQTAWATIHDPDFGISLQYPKSNTYPVHSPGGDNYWFPRGENSFFFKISRTDDV
ncbi:hypothetical protein KGQ71_04305, partial [Patescibacteria group bacterium]|nr:hypothetical protein [Patescibacteria group bacterium]